MFQRRTQTFSDFYCRNYNLPEWTNDSGVVLKCSRFDQEVV